MTSVKHVHVPLQGFCTTCITEKMSLTFCKENILHQQCCVYDQYTKQWRKSEWHIWWCIKRQLVDILCFPWMRNGWHEEGMQTPYRKETVVPSSCTVHTLLLHDLFSTTVYCACRMQKWYSLHFPKKQILTIKSNLIWQISLNRRGKKYVVILWTMLQFAKEISKWLHQKTDSAYCCKLMNCGLLHRKMWTRVIITCVWQTYSAYVNNQHSLKEMMVYVKKKQPIQIQPWFYIPAFCVFCTCCKVPAQWPQEQHFSNFTLFLGGTHKNVVLYYKPSTPSLVEVLSGGVTSV